MKERKGKETVEVPVTTVEGWGVKNRIPLWHKESKVLLRLVSLLLELSSALRVDHVCEGTLVAEGNLVDKVHKGTNGQAGGSLEPIKGMLAHTA
jgi:hypothetical protein